MSDTFRSVLGGPRWVTLDGESVRVAEMTVGGLVELGAWSSSRAASPFDLPPHPDPRVWWMAALRRAKAAPDGEVLAPPEGVDPAPWWGIALSLTTSHPEPSRLGAWIAGPGSHAAPFVRWAWLGRSDYDAAYATLDAVEGVEYPKPPAPDLRKALRAIVDRGHYTPDAIRGLTLSGFWAAAANFGAPKRPRPTNVEWEEHLRHRADLADAAKAWLRSLDGDEPEAGAAVVPTDPPSRPDRGAAAVSPEARS